MAEYSDQALRRLESKKWRFSQSRWRLWIYLSLGLFGAIGFARIAIKSKDKTLRNLAYIFSGSTFVLFSLMSAAGNADAETAVSSSTAINTLGNIAWMANLLGQIYASIKYNKIWLAYQAEPRVSTSWVAQNLEGSNVAVTRNSLPEQSVQTLGLGDEEFYRAPRVETPTRKMPPPPPPKVRTSEASTGTEGTQREIKHELLDINKAPQELLLQVPGFDSKLVELTIEERERRSGFQTFEEFASAVHLQPHQILKIEPNVVVRRDETPQRKQGRILDV